MKIVCEYCNNLIEDTEDKCPNCGAANANEARVSFDGPKTMDELKEWCFSKEISTTHGRFYWDTDCKEPQATGIYRDKETGNFIVYKNMWDGTRSIFYNGVDEAYAVYECYMRLRETILKPKPVIIQSRSNYVEPSTSYTRSSSGENGAYIKLVEVIILLIVFIYLLIFSGTN